MQILSFLFLATSALAAPAGSSHDTTLSRPYRLMKRAAPSTSYERIPMKSVEAFVGWSTKSRRALHAEKNLRDDQPNVKGIISTGLREIDIPWLVRRGSHSEAGVSHDILKEGTSSSAPTMVVKAKKPSKIGFSKASSSKINTSETGAPKDGTSNASSSKAGSEELGNLEGYASKNSKSSENNRPTKSTAKSDPLRNQTFQLWTPYDNFLMEDANERLSISPPLKDGTRMVGLPVFETDWEPLSIRFSRTPERFLDPAYPLLKDVAVGVLSLTDTKPWASMMYLEEVESTDDNPFPPFAVRFGNLRDVNKRVEPGNLVLRFSFTDDGTGPKLGYHMAAYQKDNSITTLDHIWSLCLTDPDDFNSAAQLYFGEVDEPVHYCTPGFKLRAVFPRY